MILGAAGVMITPPRPASAPPAGTVNRTHATSSDRNQIPINFEEPRYLGLGPSPYHLEARRSPEVGAAGQQDYVGRLQSGWRGVVAALCCCTALARFRGRCAKVAPSVPRCELLGCSGSLGDSGTTKHLD